LDRVSHLTIILRNAPGVYVAGYYPHNYDFLAFAASMIGRSRQALESAEKMLALSTEDMMRAPGMTFIQHHRTRHLQMKVRFARWADILDEPSPAVGRVAGHRHGGPGRPRGGSEGRP
jgi:uncharacterized protein (DUF305 family)